MTAMASAAPSTGSVPAPSSSKRIRQCSSASSKICTMFFICAEKVDKLCSMLCSSPMSANTEEKDAHGAAVIAGDMQAALRHQAEEAERL